MAVQVMFFEALNEHGHYKNEWLKLAPICFPSFFKEAARGWSNGMQEVKWEEPVGCNSCPCPVSIARINIDISQESIGIYFVKINTGKEVIMKKIIKE
jgi:hypothetical protein